MTCSRAYGIALRVSMNSAAMGLNPTHSDVEGHENLSEASISVLRRLRAQNKYALRTKGLRMPKAHDKMLWDAAAHIHARRVNSHNRLRTLMEMVEGRKPRVTSENRDYCGS